MQHDIVLKKLIFDLLTPRVRGGGVCGQNICYHVPTFRDHIKFYIRHDHGLKKSNFDLLFHFQRRIGGIGVGSAGRIFATMLLHSLFLLI